MEYFARLEKPGDFADQKSDLLSYKLDVSEGSLYENEIAKTLLIDIEFLIGENQEDRNENEIKLKIMVQKYAKLKFKLKI